MVLLKEIQSKTSEDAIREKLVDRPIPHTLLGLYLSNLRYFVCDKLNCIPIYFIIGAYVGEKFRIDILWLVIIFWFSLCLPWMISMAYVMVASSIRWDMRTKKFLEIPITKEAILVIALI